MSARFRKQLKTSVNSRLRVRAVISMIASVWMLSGCYAPSEAYGILSGQVFRVLDEAPELHQHPTTGDMIVVLAESNGETLTTVVVTLPSEMQDVLDEPLEVGHRGKAPCSVQVSSGTLEVTTRKDGTRVANAVDPTIATSTGGTLTLRASGDVWAADFSVQLEDASAVRGSFNAISQ